MPLNYPLINTKNIAAFYSKTKNLYMYFFLIFLPLFSFLWISLAGFFLGRLGSCYLGSLGLFLSLIISFFIFFEVGLNNSIVSIKLFN